MINQTSILNDQELDQAAGGFKRCTTEEGGTGMYNDETCDRLSIGQRMVQMLQILQRATGT